MLQRNIEIVAELTTNHCGNLNVLLAMVDEAAGAGASCVKMQKKDVETFYSKGKLDAAYKSPYGKTYRDYRKMFEFDLPSWQRFDKRCRERGIPWFSTAQDLPSLDFVVSEFFCRRHKISSSNARDIPFLKALAERLRPEREIVLSVAGSTLDEIAESLEVFCTFKRIWLLHCVAEYPCPIEDLRLGNIPELITSFGSDRVRIGYSGHEEGWAPSLVAAQLGAEMIERHFCLSRHSFVHHIECSLTPPEFATMARAIRDGKTAELPPIAHRIEFGMSDEEKLFLENQTYANDRLGLESQFESSRLCPRQGDQ